MSGSDAKIVDLYGQSGLYGRIIAALGDAAQDGVTYDMLKSVDEFHIGGLSATEHLIDPLKFSAATHVLDIGAGIGGTARFLNARYGAKVTGIDLTPEFVETARKLTDLVGLQATFREGSAYDLPFDKAEFDAATLIHVGMNLSDKARVFAEAARVLKPGGVLAIFDVMLFGAQPEFPLPWASAPDHSFVETPQAYVSAAEMAGLRLVRREDRGPAAMDFFAAVRSAQGSENTLSQMLLMGETAAQKRQNLFTAIQAGDLQPVELIFRLGGH